MHSWFLSQLPRWRRWRLKTISDLTPRMNIYGDRTMTKDGRWKWNQFVLVGKKNAFECWRHRKSIACTPLRKDSNWIEESWRFFSARVKKINFFCESSEQYLTIKIWIRNFVSKVALIGAFFAKSGRIIFGVFVYPVKFYCSAA